MANWGFQILTTILFQLKFPSDNFFDMARVVKRATVDNSFLFIPRNWSTLDALVNSPIIDVNAFFVHTLNILSKSCTGWFRKVSDVPDLEVPISAARTLKSCGPMKKCILLEIFPL